MKSVRTFVICLGLIFGLGSLASAQAVLGRLTPSSNSVTKVMENAGCNPGWLFQVLVDSNISVKQLRHLPIGQEVVLSADSCKDNPPDKIARMSEVLLQADAVSGLTQKSEKELASLRDELVTADATLETVQAQNRQLSLQKKNLESQLADARKAKPIVQKSEGFNSPLLASVCLAAGLLLGLALMYGHTRNRFPKDVVWFPKSWLIKQDGQDYVFTLVSAGETTAGSGNFVGKYKCPLCSEKNLFGRDQNLRTHLSSKHATERVTMAVDPSLEAIDQALDQPMNR